MDHSKRDYAVTMREKIEELTDSLISIRLRLLWGLVLNDALLLLLNSHYLFACSLNASFPFPIRSWIAVPNLEDSLTLKLSISLSGLTDMPFNYNTWNTVHQVYGFDAFHYGLRQRFPIMLSWFHRGKSDAFDEVSTLSSMNICDSIPLIASLQVSYTHKSLLFMAKRCNA